MNPLEYIYNFIVNILSHINLPEIAHRTVTVIVTILVLLLIRYILCKLIKVLFNPHWAKDKISQEKANRLQTTQSLLINIVTYVILFLGILQVIKAIAGNTFDLTPFLATAGFTGLAIGFGAQKLIRDAISGMFILLEDQYSVGDYVTINDITGFIESVGIRITRVRDDMGRLTVFSNGDITKVTNYSRGAVQSYLDIAIAAKAEVDKATAAINAYFKNSTIDGLIKKPCVMGISSFDNLKVTLRLVYKTEPGQQINAEMDIRAACRIALIENDIPLG